MENNKLPTLQIPQDVIQPIIEAHVRDAVLRSFEGYKPAVDALIASVLNVKVNSNGSPVTDRYQMDAAPRWIDWALGSVIRDAVKKALTSKVDEMRGKLETHLAAELSKKNSPLAKQLAVSLLKNFAGRETLNYRLTVLVDGVDAKGR